MKTELNREEFKAQIIKSFDKTNPDSYSKNVIFSEIEDRFEDNNGKRTVMQSMFRVRKICVVSLAILLIAVMFSGIYNSVNITHVDDGSRVENYDSSSADKNKSGKNENNKNGKNSKNNNSKKDEDNGEISFQKTLGKCFRENCAENCYYDERVINDCTDIRLAEAIEEAKLEPESVTDGDCEYIYVGMVAGTGISDRIFDKNEKHVIAIFAQRFVGGNKKYGNFNYYFNTIYGEKGYKFSYKDVNYSIFDITNVPVDEKNCVVVSAYSYDEQDVSDEKYSGCTFKLDVSDVLDTEIISTVKKQYNMRSKVLKKYNNKYYKMFTIFQYWSDLDDYDINKNKGVFKSREHMLKEHAKYQDYLDEINYYSFTQGCITDNLESFQKKHPGKTTGAGGKLAYNIDYRAFSMPYLPDGQWSEEEMDIYDRKCYYMFRKLDITPQNGLTEADIDSVTFTVENATLCRVRPSSEQEEREYSKSGYIGSMINTNDGIADERYLVYLDYGNSITIPYEDIDRMKDYGLYISNPVSDYKEYADSSENEYGIGVKLLYDEQFWQTDYLKDKVKIHINVNMTDGSDEQVIVFGNNYFYDENTDRKIGNVVCGWE